MILGLFNPGIQAVDIIDGRYRQRCLAISIIQGEEIPQMSTSLGAHDRRTNPFLFWLPTLLPHWAVLHRFHQLLGHNWLAWPQFRGHASMLASSYASRGKYSRRAGCPCLSINVTILSDYGSYLALGKHRWEFLLSQLHQVHLLFFHKVVKVRHCLTVCEGWTQGLFL